MAFEQLSDRLALAVKKISGQARLTEKNMEDMLKEVRIALLEADVNIQVIQSFLENVRSQAIGQDVYQSLNPAQMVVKVVYDELVSTLGEKESTLQLAKKPSVVMMVGLQGTGKTTSAAKIAQWLVKKEAKKVMLVAADLVRPAAVEQLKILGDSVNVPVFSLGMEASVLSTAQAGYDYAIEQGFDVVIVDTAGRLDIDEYLMDELNQVAKLLSPDEILLTVDAMTGQEIAHVAHRFHQQLDCTGLVVTKFDGDARGGGVLSVRKIAAIPVKFVTTGEKMEDIDLFYPERMASRILGMGDILTLVEQAESKIDVEKSQKGAERMLAGTFDLQDMLNQIEQMSKLGSLTNLLKMVPGANQLASRINDEQANESMNKSKAIIQSMTKYERENPDSLRASRKARIAKGSGTTISEVNQLIKQFEKTKEQMRMMMRMNPNQPAIGPRPVGSNTRPNPNKKKNKKRR